jgi:hypothetical protein
MERFMKTTYLNAGVILIFAVLFALPGCLLPDMPAFGADQIQEVVIEGVSIASETEPDASETEPGASETEPDASETEPDASALSSVTRSGSSFTLVWDPAAGSIGQYHVYYRAKGAGNWAFLDSVAASDQPTYTITSLLFPPGTYEFGVTSVDPWGNESPLHTSLDESADPASGWFLEWNLE